MNAFFTELEAELAAGVKAIAVQITAAAHFFKPILAATAAELAQVALQAVLQQAPLVLSGQQKFSAASSTVLTKLGAAGKQAAIADVQVAVQAAYNAIAAAAHP